MATTQTRPPTHDAKASSKPRRALRTLRAKIVATMVPLVLGSAASYFLGADFWKGAEQRLGTAGPSMRVQVIADVDAFHSDVAHAPELFVPRSIAQMPAAPMAPGEPGFRRWARDLGGVDAGSSLVRLVVQGTSADAVILQDARIKVVARRPPLTRGALLVPAGQGSGQVVRHLMGELDTRPASLVDVGSRGGPDARFPLKVTKTDTEIFDVEAWTEACDCSWVVELDYTYDGQSRRTMIDDGGQPFRTTAHWAWADVSASDYLAPDWAPVYTWQQGWKRAPNAAVACGPLAAGGRAVVVVATGAGTDCSRSSRRTSPADSAAVG